MKYVRRFILIVFLALVAATTTGVYGGDDECITDSCVGCIDDCLGDLP